MITLAEVKERAVKENNKSFRKLFFFSSRFSIYFSWVFINLGLSANQVTALFFLTGFLGSLCFLTFDLIFILIGVFLWRLHIIFDLCDGEVARFNKTFSINGAYWDYMIHAFLFPFCFFCITFSLSKYFNNPQFLLLGVAGVLTLSLMLATKNNYYRAMLFSGKVLDVTESARTSEEDRYSIRDMILYTTSFDAMLLVYLALCALGLDQLYFIGILIVYIFFFLMLGLIKFYLFSRDGVYRRRS